MARDVLRRVRWGNVPIALATLICLGAVVGWPRLSPPGPQLPADAARPVLTAAPRGAAGLAPTPEPAGRRAARRGAGSARADGGRPAATPERGSPRRRGA